VLPLGVRLVRVGVEACGHYHLPVTAAGVWPDGWKVVELNPRASELTDGE
jgi:transposase